LLASHQCFDVPSCRPGSHRHIAQYCLAHGHLPDRIAGWGRSIESVGESR
jgi:hypothetical protein